MSLFKKNVPLKEEEEVAPVMQEYSGQHPMLSFKSVSAIVESDYYIGRHPTLSYRGASASKHQDHLQEYVEVHPFQNTEPREPTHHHVVSRGIYATNKIVDTWEIGASAAGTIWNGTKWIADELGITKALQNLYTIIKGWSESALKNVISLMTDWHIKLMDVLPTISSIRDTLIEKLRLKNTVNSKYFKAAVQKLSTVITFVTAAGRQAQLYMTNTVQYALKHTYEQRKAIKEKALKGVKKAFVMVNGQIKDLANHWGISPGMFGAKNAEDIKKLIKRFKKKGGGEDEVEKEAILALTLGKLKQSLEDEKDTIIARIAVGDKVLYKARVKDARDGKTGVVSKITDYGSFIIKFDDGSHGLETTDRNELVFVSRPKSEPESGGWWW